jgi:hypothetical protein
MMISQLAYLILYAEILKVSGLIPSEIGNLSQLVKLSLESQYAIPSEIGKLSRLGKKVCFWAMEVRNLVG